MARCRGSMAVLSSAAFFVGAAKAQIPEEDGWRPWGGIQSREKTKDKLRAKGRGCAEAEYRDGWHNLNTTLSPWTFPGRYGNSPPAG